MRNSYIALVTLATLAVTASLPAGCSSSSSAPAPGADDPSTTNPAPPSAGGGSGTAGAERAADAWLALVDGGRYPESWDTAAAFFRGALPRDQWSTQVGAVRGPLGAMRSRRQRSATAATTLPGAPDGSYVVIQYDSSFANKASAIETVTPMLDADGQWRVSGYYIR